jgi:lipopolysaccharide transport system ATP-binding protein
MAEFQKKCHAKMRELAGKGTTVLFVSHSSEDIIDMCDKAIWLNHGHMVDMGEAEYIVNKYLNQ